MDFEITWIDTSLVICRTSGAASVEGYEAMMEALTSQPQFRPGIDLIVDHTNVDVSALTAAEIEQVAALRAHFVGDVTARAAGVVGPGSPLRYGLGRMFEAFLDSQPGSKIRVFETVEEAMAWLRGTDSAPS
ncbi:MAG: SpoIIAA family protein [Gaiellaceae bacterium]